jgi:hypothetical protein
MTRPGLVPQVAPCVVSHNLALGGAQIAVLRMIQCLPEWVRERTTLYSQSDDMPLIEHALNSGFRVGRITTEAPEDPSCWVLSYGKLDELPERPTSLILHSWDDEGWRYITRTYGNLRGLTVAGVSQQVLDRFAPFIEQGGHSVAGVLPPPVTEYTMAKGRRSGNRIVVAWMGRPLESKGLLSIPWLLRLDPRIVVRAYTGAETGGNQYTRRVQGEAMRKLVELARELNVLDRLDLRPLDFNPFNYRERLRGAHVLLGNSRREGFLMTAAEALSCGVPVVVTRSCGVAEFIQEGVNGCLINWDEDPAKLARTSHEAILRAVHFKQMDCLRSVQDLSAGANYKNAFGPGLAQLTHTSLINDDARVTIGLRIHKGMPIESLDQAAGSIAGQTYRRFKTVLLVDGPHDYAEKLAERYQLPLICTGMEPDITHCSWLHRQAVAQCDTEFYKPLDYDDQLLPGYLERAVATLDAQRADVYGCLLMTLDQNTGEFSERWWPNKPLSTMFTGRSDDNQLPHSSVMMRTKSCLKAGNYQERAIGLGADDYNLWFRLYNSGAKIVRDDAVRNVAYRIHEKNSLKIRKARSGSPSNRGKVAAAAAAAGLAAIAAPRGASAATVPPVPSANQPQHVVRETKPQREKKTTPHGKRRGPMDMALNPPHS